MAKQVNKDSIVADCLKKAKKNLKAINSVLKAEYAGQPDYQHSTIDEVINGQRPNVKTATMNLLAANWTVTERANEGENAMPSYLLNAAEETAAEPAAE